MKKPTIVNLSAFTPTEELVTIKNLGFPVVECSPESVSTLKFESKKDAESAGLLRASRLEGKQYEDLYAALAERGIHLRNSPEISARLSEFELHYPLIADVSPRALVFPSNASAKEVVERIKSSGFGGSVFIKTEKKSLKAESMIREVDLENVERCLQALTKAFAPFKTYVIKEVVPLESTDHRAVVFGTHIAGFDTGPHVKDKAAVQSRVFEFVYDCVGMLARKGLVGDFVIDVAKRTDTGDFVVVEIKDLQFTQIKNPDFIWEQIARHGFFA